MVPDRVRQEVTILCATKFATESWMCFKMMSLLVFRDELEVAFDLGSERSWLLFCILSCLQIPPELVEGETRLLQFSYVQGLSVQCVMYGLALDGVV